MGLAVLQSSIRLVMALRAWSRPKNRLSFRSSSRTRPLKLSDIAILHGLGRRDVMPFPLVVLRPGEDRVRGQHGAVFGDDQAQLAAAGDQLGQFPGDTAA